MLNFSTVFDTLSSSGAIGKVTASDDDFTVVNT
jgi:hypothetical protein